MTSGPRGQQALGLFLLFLLPLAACGRKEGGVAPDPAGAEAMSEQEIKEMEAKAMALYQQGQVAPVKRKIRIFASLIARYPRSRLVPMAYMHLIRNLFEKEVADYEEAYLRTLAFAQRVPGDPNVSECFHWVYRRGRFEGWKPERMREIEKAWMAYLDRALDEGFAKGDAAIRHLIDKGLLLRYQAQRAGSEGRGEDERRLREAALAAYDRAFAFFPAEEKRWQLDILLQKASVEAELGARDAAVETFRAAARLAGEGKSTSYTPDDVGRWMQTLGLDPAVLEKDAGQRSSK